MTTDMHSTFTACCWLPEDPILAHAPESSLSLAEPHSPLGSPTSPLSPSSPASRNFRCRQKLITRRLQSLGLTSREPAASPPPSPARQGKHLGEEAKQPVLVGVQPRSFVLCPRARQIVRPAALQQSYQTS
eukprot:TRINITY_DN2216_c0_g1_i1.p1 TRINITY_DN2216_c0_g1~~TRINITY_DN2216_c0_g1_i1.p1  ORF type:complete len:131 (-),score=14.72 TRINITY_DN2216_c0_g1_i1:363-755(-)